MPSPRISLTNRQTQTTTVKLQTKMVLSPLQLQTVKLLGLSADELEKHVAEELEKNAALDQDEEQGAEESYDGEEEFDNIGGENGEDANDEIAPQWDESQEDPDDDFVPIGISRKVRKNNDDIEGGFETYVASSKTLFEELQEQVDELDIDDDMEYLVLYILRTLDNNGFLSRTPQQLSDDILFKQGKDYPIERVKDAIKIVQGLEPSGLGAADLQESLLIQLRNKNDSPAKCLAERVVKSNYDELTHNNFERIMKRCKVSREELAVAMDVIRHLDPHPGRFSSADEVVANQEVPEFVVHDNNGQLILTLNKPNIPQLKVSNSYMDALKVGKGKERETIAKQIDAARSFMEALKQRHETMYKVMYCIVQMQRTYFETGDTADLRPMLLKDVADVLKCDESTVSRVTNNKSVQTDFGIVRLRELFSLSTTDVLGNEISIKRVKAALKKIVDEEDKHAPFSDQALAGALIAQGYNVKRRTVAKYREELGLPNTSLRKQI